MPTTNAALQRLAAEVRGELGLRNDDPFDPHAWAEEYGVPFVSLNDIDADAAAVAHFTRTAPELWSAALLRDGYGHVVLYNPVHSRERLRSNLAHEVAHFVAEHILSGAWLDATGTCPGGGAVQEREAAELAGALLLPPEAAKAHAIRGHAALLVADKFKVSTEMAQWRMNVSGGYIIAKRSKVRRAVRS